MVFIKQLCYNKVKIPEAGHRASFRIKYAAPAKRKDRRKTNESNSAGKENRMVYAGLYGLLYRVGLWQRR